MRAPEASTVLALVAMLVAGGREAPRARAPADSARASVPAPIAPAGNRFVGQVDVGFDSFEERYSIVEQDTVDSVNEWRARLRLGYARGSFLRNYFLVEGRTSVGRGNYETGGRMRFARQLGNNIRSRISVEADLARREFGGGSVYQFPNDYTRGWINAFVRLGLGSSFSVRLTDRLERQDFAERTDFDYDYTRNSLVASGEYDWNFTSLVNGALRYTTMSIPDSAEIEYESWTPYLEFRSSPELRRQVYVQASAERRLYGSGATRSSFWAWLALLSGEWLVSDPLGFSVEDSFELYRYDAGTDAYFDYAENRLAVLVNLYTSWYSRFSAGPSWGILRSGRSPEDEYNEYGGVFRWEYNRGASLWISLQYEPGRRSYPAFDPNATLDVVSVFSDYAYNRVSAFVNWKVWNGVGFNMILDYTPEDHEREGDDATATLFSAGVSWGF